MGEKKGSVFVAVVVICYRRSVLLKYSVIGASLSPLNFALQHNVDVDVTSCVVVVVMLMSSY